MGIDRAITDLDETDAAARRQTDKIAAQRKRMAKGAMIDRRIMIEMQSNKASLDLNRALRDFAESKDD